MIEIDGVPLREYLLAGTASGLKTKRRLERSFGGSGSVVWLAVPVAYTHVPRRKYGTRDEPVIDKFMRRVRKDPDGHWRWTGHRDRQGYGRFSLKVDGKYKTVGAHRWIYEHTVRPLLPDETIDHLNDVCGIPSCVNPAHLDPCSGGENARRARVRYSLAGRSECDKGHVLAEVGTRVDDKGTVLCLKCREISVTGSRKSFFMRRAIECAASKLSAIICAEGHVLTEEGALSSNGTCKRCNAAKAKARRDAKRAAEDSL